jgi:hypothetical protein
MVREQLTPLRLVILITLAVIAAIWVIVAIGPGPGWLWHPLGQCAGHAAEVERCKSYNFHSGIAANIGELALVASVLGGAATLFRSNNCSVTSPRFCWRFGHPVAGTSFKACRKHHPSKWRKEDGQVTAHHIDCAHKEVPK